jgi:hypothetical protein
MWRRNAALDRRPHLRAQIVAIGPRANRPSHSRGVLPPRSLEMLRLSPNPDNKNDASSGVFPVRVEQALTSALVRKASCREAHIAILPDKTINDAVLVRHEREHGPHTFVEECRGRLGNDAEQTAPGCLELTVALLDHRGRTPARRKVGGSNPPGRASLRLTEVLSRLQGVDRASRSSARRLVPP